MAAAWGNAGSETKSSELCSECDNLLNSDFDVDGHIYPYFFRFWPTTSAGETRFDTPGLEDCPLCSVIAESAFGLLDGTRIHIPPFKPFPSTPGINFRVRLSRAEGDDDYCKLLFESELDGPEGESDTAWGTACEVVLVPASDPRAARLPKIVLEGSTTDSEKGFGIMRSWLEHCCDGHDVCSALSAREPGKEAWMPSRLLEYVSGLDSSEEMVRVCEEFPSPPVPYATLSHRWGGNQTLTLQHDNYDQLKLGIPLVSLPQTFKEAIMAAKELGITYIWIDCLCIMQDDIDDWAREAAMVADVYRHGLINISASSSENSDRGLYRRRVLNPLGMLPCALDVRFAGIPRGRYYAVSGGLLRRSDGAREWVDVLKHRGWVFQEHTLAPRIIHFSQNQFFWQCQALEASESCPEGPALPVTEPSLDEWDGSRPSLRLLHRLSADDRRLGLGYFWGRLVMNYTNRLLTRKTDRLVAISAVASEAAKAHPVTATYVAGLWSSQLEQMLLWRATPGASERSSVYTAPTWSWASVTGPVATHSWWGQYDRLLAEATATVEARFPYGAVTGGKLKLKGHLRPAEVLLTAPVGHNYFQDYQTPIDRLLRFQEAPGTAFSGNQAFIDVEDKAIPSFPVYCVPILASGEEASGLLLERIGGVDGPYRRVGIFECRLDVFLSENGDWAGECERCEIEVI